MLLAIRSSSCFSPGVLPDGLDSLDEGEDDGGSDHGCGGGDLGDEFRRGVYSDWEQEDLGEENEFGGADGGLSVPERGWEVIGVPSSKKNAAIDPRDEDARKERSQEERQDAADDF